MRLRNKKTGEVVDFLTLDLVDSDEMEFVYVQASGHENAWGYRSLEKFNEEWEDYVPKEPLIKDEKVRKAVRAWAEANDMNSDSTVVCGKFDDGFETDNSGIEFDCTIRDVLSGVKRGENYTIAELCGEGEE